MENLYKIGDKFDSGEFKFEVIGFDDEGRIISQRIGKADEVEEPLKLPEKIVVIDEPVADKEGDAEPENEPKTPVKAPVKKTTATKKKTTTKKRTTTAKK